MKEMIETEAVYTLCLLAHSMDVSLDIGAKLLMCSLAICTPMMLLT